MVDLNEKEIEVISGAGPWAVIAEFAAIYDAACDFARGFWKAAKEEAGIK